MSVTLTMTWQPRGELARFRRYLPLLWSLYEAIIVIVTPDAPAEVVKALAEMPEVWHEIMPERGTGRYQCLHHALKTEAAFIHYCDMDRLVRWVEMRPDELRQTVTRLQTTDATIIGRTAAAFQTHPAALTETETIILDVFEPYFGERLDIAAGSKAFSRGAAAFLHKHGRQDDGLGADAEWPILLRRGGFALQSWLVDGLDWESADQYQNTAADSEMQRQAAQAYDHDVGHWRNRVGVARAIIQRGLEALTRPLEEGE